MKTCFVSFLQVKLDVPGKPSRVLHFRGVPLDASEGEIVQLGLPFGRMTNLVLAKKKNQVGKIIEMEILFTYHDY